MAWIAVHQQVDGAKLRQLRKTIGCSKLEALGILVVLWLWGIDNADRDGTLRAADADDLAELFTLGLSKGVSAGHVVKSLISTGWIDLHGEQMALHDWEDWQEQWYKALDRREKDRKRKRESTAGKTLENPRKFHGKSAEVPLQPSPSPSSLPPEKRDNPSVGGGDRAGAHERAENDVGVYLQDRQLDPFSTFGATEEIIGETACFTDAIFKKFACRRSTDTDIALVFERIRHQEHDAAKDTSLLYGYSREIYPSGNRTRRCCRLLLRSVECLEKSQQAP